MSNNRNNPRARKPRRDWTKPFLAALEEGETVSGACRAARINRTTAYRRRVADEDFALAWHDLEESATDRLEATAYRRALEGSDRLMEFLLKARRPDLYREGVNVHHTGATAKVELVVPDDDDRAKRIARILAAADAVEP